MPRDFADDRDAEFDDEIDDDRRPARGRSSRIVDRAREQVKGPAIALLVAGIVSLLLSLAGIINVFTMDKQLADVEAQWDRDPNLNAQQKQDMKKMLGMWRDALKVALPISIGTGVLVSLITIFGAVQMMKLSGRGMAMAGSILSMFPCGGCCLLGMPIGIWALVVLARPEVKAGFAAAQGRHRDRDEY